MVTIKGRRERGIFFTPRLPDERHTIWHVMKALDAPIRELGQGADLGFLGDGGTYARLEPRLIERVGRHDIINLYNHDISKRHVDRVFRHVFGISAELDPRFAAGVGVQKSNDNCVKDGKVVHLPIDDPDPGSVFNRLIDNRVSDSMVEDLRTPVVKGAIPIVFVKHRHIRYRFSGVNDSVALAKPGDVFTNVEIGRIVAFCRAIYLDFGEIDVLRDRSSGLLYIVDANRCTSGPPTKLGEGDKAVGVGAIAERFADSFFVDRGRS